VRAASRGSEPTVRNVRSEEHDEPLLTRRAASGRCCGSLRIVASSEPLTLAKYRGSEAMRSMLS
jgi:hypothetical protein